VEHGTGDRVEKLHGTSLLHAELRVAWTSVLPAPDALFLRVISRRRLGGVPRAGQTISYPDSTP
jgi:hypothetical protein